MDGLAPVPTPSPPENYRVSRADIVKEASKRVPLNTLGLPEGYHRSDLLHEHVVVRVVPQEALLQVGEANLSEGVLTDDGPLLVLNERAVRAAYVPLDFREGFPTDSKSGIPFWHHLEFEPIDAFYAFERYLNQGKNEGTRRLFALACTPEIQAIALGSSHPLQLKRLGPPALRQATTAEEEFQTEHNREQEEFEINRELSIETNRKLQEWFTLYYWGPRARAHDLFYLDGIRRSQAMMSLQLQNTHYQDATTLYNRVLGYINGTTEESKDEDGRIIFWRDMTPRVLVDFLKTLSTAQRLSLGLPGNAPPSTESAASVVSMLRSLAGVDPVLVGGRAGSSSEGSARGRPRQVYDENNNLIIQPPSSGGGASQSSQSSSDLNKVQQEGSISDEDRMRRLAVIFNRAKHRKDATAELEAREQARTDLQHPAEPAEDED